MKRIISFLVLLIITASISYADTIINDIDIFSKLFPRTEGSDNETLMLDTIKQRLDGLGVSSSEIDFGDAEGFHSFSSYIDVKISGGTDAQIITVIPVDLTATEDNPSSGCWSIAAALDVIEAMAADPPDISMRFIFLGAENGGDTPLGTRYFLEHFHSADLSLFIYLSVSDTPSSLRLLSGADGYTSPYSLFSLVSGSFSEAGISWSHSSTESILFRLSAAGRKSPIADYLKAGYPAVGIETADSSGTMISGEQMTAFYYSLAESTAEGYSDDRDIHYVFGLNEWNYLLVYITVIALLMLYPIFRRRHFGWYMRTLTRSFWSLPLLFLFTYALLALSTIAIRQAMSAAGFPELWRYKPFTVFMIKITAALLMYSLSFRLIRKLPFSRRGSFYSISSIFFLTAGLLVLTWLDLSLSFFALWPLFFIFLFTIVRKPVVKLVFLAASVIWLVIAVYEIFMLPAYPAIRLMSISILRGNLLSALILLPFILAAIRLDLSAPVSKKITRFTPYLLLAVLLLLGLSILVSPPFNESSPQPITVYQIINSDDGSRSLSIDSPAPIDKKLADRLESEFEFRKSEGEDIRIGLSGRSFLSRKILSFDIDFAGNPEGVRIILNSPAALTLYESSYPAAWYPSDMQAEVYIGKNPPSPLEFSMTVNRSAVLDIEVSADYPPIVEEISFEGRKYLVTGRLTITGKKRYDG